MAKSNMNISNSTLLIILLIICFVGGFIIAFYKSSFIENFSSASKKLTVEYYYMDGCGYCTTFKPEWDKFKSQVDSSKPSKKYDYASYNISDKSVGSARGTKFNISGTPTVIITDAKDNIVDTFGGDRNASALINFADEVARTN